MLTEEILMEKTKKDEWDISLSHWAPEQVY